MRFMRILAVPLAIFATLYIAYDYSAGHMDAKPWDIIQCPICLSFLSTESVPEFNCESICTGQYTLIGILAQQEQIFVEKTVHGTIARRGPPLSPCNKA